MRLRTLMDELGDALVVEERAFPLRPAPERGATFRGSYREAGWRRCGEMSAADGVVFTPWPHPEMPGWSLPALEAAKCVAKQGDEAFRRVHQALFRAYFTDSRNIGDPHEVIRIVAECDVDTERFIADYRSGIGREAVVADFESAVNEHGVRSIPTVVVPATGRFLVGLADPAAYRAVIEEARERAGDGAQDRSGGGAQDRSGGVR